MAKQPLYLEKDGLRDSIVEMYYSNSPFTVNHIAKTILEAQGMESFSMIEDQNNGSVFLQNDFYRIQVRPDCISFNNIKEYQRWPNYAPLIQKVITQVLTLQDITIGRQMIRYISMFPNVSIFDNLNGKKMELNAIPQIDGTEIRFKMAIGDQNNHFGIATIRLTDNLPSNKPNVKVSVVDIEIDTKTDNERQSETLEFLHTQERNLFFSILDKQFIDSLGAHYE